MLMWKGQRRKGEINSFWFLWWIWECCERGELCLLAPVSVLCALHYFGSFRICLQSCAPDIAKRLTELKTYPYFCFQFFQFLFIFHFFVMPFSPFLQTWRKKTIDNVIFFYININCNIRTESSFWQILGFIWSTRETI